VTPSSFVEERVQFVAPPPTHLSFGEMPPFSIKALWGEMDNLLAWSDQLRVELDIGTAHRNVQVEHLLNANREMSVRVDQLQDKFDHFIDEHWCPMQHFACGVVSCLAVFAGDSSFEPPFDVGTRSEPGAPFPPPPSQCSGPSPESFFRGGHPPIPPQFFSNTGVGLDSYESLPLLLSQSSHPSSSGSWESIEPHVVYSRLDAGQRQLSEGEFLSLFSTSAGHSPEPGAAVADAIATDVPITGEGVRGTGGPGSL